MVLSLKCLCWINLCPHPTPGSPVEAPVEASRVTVVGDNGFTKESKHKGGLGQGPNPIWLMSLRKEEGTAGMWVHGEKAM